MRYTFHPTILKLNIQMIIKGSFRKRETIQILPQKDLQGDCRTPILSTEPGPKDVPRKHSHG